jgi:hypothetical protein
MVGSTMAFGAVVRKLYSKMAALDGLRLKPPP